MKKQFRFALIAAVVCGFSLAVTSCKDDDKEIVDENGTEQPIDAFDDDGSTAAWRLLCALTDADSLASDWQSRQYEPTVGETMSTGQFERYVQVNDLADAKMHFGSMADLTPDEIGETVTVPVQDMGTLTWTQSPQGDNNIATVDVRLKQIPHLQRIVYRTTGQMGDNASVFGTAYYRLGDVVVDKDGYYWVCVRPALSGFKDKCYWMNIINAAETGRDPQTGKLPGYPAKNLYDYSNHYYQNTIHLPTGLAYEHRQIYELCNLIWALLSPSSYHSKVGDNGKGLGGFDYTYHGEKFLEHVSYYWDQFDIWQKLFNRDHRQMMRYFPQGGKIIFFYNGKNWKVGSTARLWKYVSRGYEENYNRKQSQDEVLYEMKAEKTGFDILRAAQDPNAANIDDCPQPEKDDGMTGVWVIRMKSGSDLAVGKYSPTSDLGVRPVYRFNANIQPNATTGSDLQTERDIPSMDGLVPFTGQSYYHTSDVLRDEQGHLWMVTCPSGMPYDNSPYTELVSLDALTFSDNGAYATNASKLKEVQRGFPFLWNIFHSCYSASYVYKVLPSDFSGTYGILLPNLAKANIDPRLLVQYLVRETNPDARNKTEVCSVPYRVEGDTKQRLMRFMLTSDTGNKDLLYNFWLHYPSVPSDKDRYQRYFSDQPIFLQDVADQDKVKTYGVDYYATRPLDYFDFNGTDAREYRKNADDVALKFSNYKYDYVKWFNSEYPTDMWNQPVIPVVFDAVLDLGEKKHEKISVKGHLLERLHPIPWSDDGYNTMDATREESVWGSTVTAFNGTICIDGKIVSIPSFREVWYNNRDLE